MNAEKLKKQFNGWIILLIHFIFSIISLLVINSSIDIVPSTQLLDGYLLVLGIILLIFSIFVGYGYFTLEPNKATILMLFGKYIGTEKTSGFRWTIPLFERKKVSLRVRNFDSEKLKVNDKKGNPIEISAVVVWKVFDTAEAEFEVDDFIDYVHMQSESAIRHLAMSYSYDGVEGEELSLRSSIEEVSEQLKVEIEKMVVGAGVEIIEARINHLAYAPEIAHAMLQRQQAEAIIEARAKIVDGAVGMVEMALDKLSKDNIVELDEERKATLVGNLMLVLCSDKDAQPIVNAGSLY
jgi:regulator of protease activity HflC (stomatin/prohibitin superfamily)